MGYSDAEAEAAGNVGDALASMIGPGGLVNGASKAPQLAGAGADMAMATSKAEKAAATARAGQASSTTAKAADEINDHIMYNKDNTNVPADTPIPPPKEPFGGAYTPGETTVFSGIIDVRSGQLKYRPSDKTVLSDGTVPQGLVRRNGGHEDVMMSINRRIRGRFKDYLAFTLHYEAKGTIRISFRSRSITKRFNRANGLGRKSEPTAHYKDYIINAIKKEFPGVNITY